MNFDDLPDQGGAAAVPKFDDMQHQDPGLGQTAWDVAKQIPAGLAAGAEALPGATASLLGMVGRGVESGVRALGLESPEVAEQIRQREALKQQLQSRLPTLEKSGILPEPETTAGQYARTSSEFVPAALAGPGGLTRRIVTGAVAPGLASEAAGQATAGTEAEPYARAAATFMPFGRIRPGEVKPSFDSEELFASGRQRYKQVDALDAQWKPEAIADLGDRIDASLSRSFNRKKNDAVYSVIDELRGLREPVAPEEVGRKPFVSPAATPRTPLLEDLRREVVPEGYYDAPPKKFVSASDIDAARAQLRDAAADHSQSAASWHAVKMLDDYMAKTPQSDMLQGNAQQVSKLLGAARDDWAAAYRTQIATGKLMLGHFNADTSNSGMNLDNSVRQAVKQLIRPNKMGEIPARKLGYNDDEIAAMQQIVQGTKTRNFIRYAGNLMGGGGGALQAMWGVGALGMGYYEGDPRYALAAPIGFLLRKGANRITDSEAASLAALVSRRSALGRATPSTMLPSQIGPLGTAGVLRAGTAADQTDQRAAGGRVKGLATKTQANYRGGNYHWSCGWCTMFIKPSSCSAVRGHISPKALCDYYEPEKGHERLVDNKYDVVTGANSSKKPTGPIYIDRHIPEWSPKLRTKTGKRVRLWTYLSIHEDEEQRCMEVDGDKYDTAHQKAEAKEKAALEKDGGNWKQYSDEIDGFLKQVEHEKVAKKPPMPLHVKPEQALDHHRGKHRKRRADGGPVEEEPPTGTPNPISAMGRPLQIGVGPGFVSSQVPGAAPLEPWAQVAGGVGNVHRYTEPSGREWYTTTEQNIVRADSVGREPVFAKNFTDLKRTLKLTGRGEYMGRKEP